MQEEERMYLIWFRGGKGKKLLPRRPKSQYFFQKPILMKLIVYICSLIIIGQSLTLCLETRFGTFLNSKLVQSYKKKKEFKTIEIEPSVPLGTPTSLQNTKKQNLKISQQTETATPGTIKQKKHFTFISMIHHSTETLAKSESPQYSRNLSNLTHN